jgi:hypothetical protein
LYGSSGSSRVAKHDEMPIVLSRSGYTRPPSITSQKNGSDGLETMTVDPEYSRQHRKLAQLREGRKLLEKIETSSQQSMRMRIREASIRLAFAKGDPHCDFSWNSADPSVAYLPTDLVNAKQLEAFECLMTDLRFLRRLLQMAGGERTLLIYENAQAVFAAESRACHRLESYIAFVSKYVVPQHMDPQLLFRVALSCKLPMVKGDAAVLVDKFARKIRSLNDVISADAAEPVHFVRAASVAVLRVGGQNNSLLDHAVYDEATRYLRLAAQVSLNSLRGNAEAVPQNSELPAV